MTETQYKLGLSFTQFPALLSCFLHYYIPHLLSQNKSISGEEYGIRERASMKRERVCVREGWRTGIKNDKMTITTIVSVMSKSCCRIQDFVSALSCCIPTLTLQLFSPMPDSCFPLYRPFEKKHVYTNEQQPPMQEQGIVNISSESVTNTCMHAGCCTISKRKSFPVLSSRVRASREARRRD